jgi:hypothetical protein
MHKLKLPIKLRGISSIQDFVCDEPKQISAKDLYLDGHNWLQTEEDYS